MRIAIGNDRNGILYKQKLKAYLEAEGYQVVDCGTNEDFPADYPIYGERVGRLVADGTCDRGIVICATGIGICSSANKVRGIRAGLAYTDDVARLMRAHNDANVIAFGQDFMVYEDVQRRTDIFLDTAFGGGVSPDQDSADCRYRGWQANLADASHEYGQQACQGAIMV